MSEAKKLPQPVDGVMDIAAYVPGSSKAPTGVKLHKLSSNETPLGSSPKAQQALADFAGSLEIYPDGSAIKLREAISQAHGLNAENILCGNGSDEILAMIASAYLSAGDEAIYTEHGFLVYEIEILANSAKPVVVKERDLTCDVDAILAAVTPKTKIVFLANPNNPTGTYVPAEDVRRLHAGLPSNVILVLDAAYAEYVRRNDYQAGIELVSSSDNVVMTRTFSKIHGLAGLRVGWCYGPKAIIDALNRIRGPFNMNSAAIEAGSAAIQDKAFVESAVDHNEKWLEWTTKELEKIGLEITPSVGNFILIHFTENKGKTAVDANDYLVERGMVLRLVAGYGLPNALRMTIGTEEANRAVVGALTAFLDE